MIAVVVCAVVEFSFALCGEIESGSGEDKLAIADRGRQRSDICEAMQRTDA